MTPDAELAEHLARALWWYFRHERRNGRSAPVELLDIAHYILESPGLRQDATNGGMARRTEQHGRMRDELLTKRQAADVLVTSVRSVERAISAGELLAVKVGRSVRIKRGDLDDYIAARRGSFRDRVTEKDSA